MEAHVHGLVGRLRDEHKFVEAAIVRYLRILREGRATGLDELSPLP